MNYGVLEPEPSTSKWFSNPDFSGAGFYRVVNHTRIIAWTPDRALAYRIANIFNRRVGASDVPIPPLKPHRVGYFDLLRARWRWLMRHEPVAINSNCMVCGEFKPCIRRGDIGWVCLSCAQTPLE